MCLDAERDGPQWVREHDARCTKHGKALRKSRMDELPQLINIIVGDRGIIGTTKKNIDFSSVVTA